MDWFSVSKFSVWTSELTFECSRLFSVDWELFDWLSESIFSVWTSELTFEGILIVVSVHSSELYSDEEQFLNESKTLVFLVTVTGSLTTESSSEEL